VEKKIIFPRRGDEITGLDGNKLCNFVTFVQTFSKKKQKNPKKSKKTPKNPKKSKKKPKNPLGWVFLKKPGFLPTLRDVHLLHAPFLQRLHAELRSSLGEDIRPSECTRFGQEG
jgi:hypothetical protein